MRDSANRLKLLVHAQLTALPFGTESVRRIVAAVLVLAVTALHVAVFPEAALVVDSGRDISNAWAIASGQSYPATGPAIYGTWALGPVWYYVLAVPLLLGGSLLTLALWVGLIASCKIPLAYLLGRRWYGAAGGLVFAAVIALPGWSSVGAIALVHTSVIETAVLGSLLASSRALARPDTVRLTAAAVVLSLAMHAHPLALVVAPWLAAAYARRFRQGPGARALGLGFGAFLAPWLPMLIAEAAAGWPQLLATQRFASEGGFLARTTEFVPAISGLLTGWAPLTARYLVPELGSIELQLSILWYVGWGLAMVGVLLAFMRRSWLASALLANLVIAVLVVCVARPGVLLHMLYAVFPLAAWTFVHGWSQLGGKRWLQSTGFLGLLVAGLLQLGVLLERRAIAEVGVVTFPGEAFADVRAPVRDDGRKRFWLPIKDHERIAKLVCGGRTALHGELAAAYAWARSVAIVRSCGSMLPTLGGKEANRHLVGIPVANARQLHVPGRRIGHGFVILHPTAVLFPVYGLRAKADPRYAVLDFGELHARHGIRGFTFSAACPRDHLLSVTNLVPVLNPMSLRVTRSGSDQMLGGEPPVLQTIAASYFACGSGMNLRFEVETLEPAAIDIVLIPGGRS